MVKLLLYSLKSTAFSVAGTATTLGLVRIDWARTTAATESATCCSQSICTKITVAAPQEPKALYFSNSLRLTNILAFASKRTNAALLSRGFPECFANFVSVLLRSKSRNTAESQALTFPCCCFLTIYSCAYIVWVLDDSWAITNADFIAGEHVPTLPVVNIIWLFPRTLQSFVRLNIADRSVPELRPWHWFFWALSHSCVSNWYQPLSLDYCLFGLQKNRLQRLLSRPVCLFSLLHYLFWSFHLLVMTFCKMDPSNLFIKTKMIFELAVVAAGTMLLGFLCSFFSIHVWSSDPILVAARISLRNHNEIIVCSDFDK